MATKVRVDRGALRKAIAEDVAMQQSLDETTDAIIEKAEELNPDATGYSKKRYRKRRFRLRRRLGNTDPFFHLIEFGSVNNPAYAPMRKAVSALGLRLRPNPKAEATDDA